MMEPNDNRKISFAFGIGTCLSELDASSLEAIMKAATRRFIEKGRIICLEGDSCPGLIIIESGLIKGVKVSPQGREQEIRLAGPGEMINEISVMAGDLNLLTLKTLEDSVVWIFERKLLFDLMAEHPMLSNIISQNMAQRLVNLLDLVEDLALRNVEGRLAHLLLNHPKENPIKDHHWSTRTEMASRIGTTYVVVSRVLHEMQDQGTIRLDGHEVYIVDQKKLEMVAFQQYK